jgi:glutamyl-tRNA reductase
MNKEIYSSTNNWFSVGISYKKSDAKTRESFSISLDNQAQLILEAKEKGCEGIFLISTCNRTELYAFTSCPEVLFNLLVTHSNGTYDLLKQNAFVYQGNEAITHLFKVGSGLDSQIIGDFEIIGQIKKSFELSVKHEAHNTFTDRIYRAVVQTSRKIKSETSLSTGATSVAFAGVHYIKTHFPNIETKKITLFGTGQLGKNTCENLVKHMPFQEVTLINRDQKKAEMLSKKFHFNVKAQEELVNEIGQTDILFVSTGAGGYTITPEHITTNKPLLVLDLSMPRNVDPAVGSLPNVDLLHMDELSHMINDNIAQRSAQLPVAEKIMDSYIAEFNEWVGSRKMVPTLKALNHKLKAYKDNELQKMVKDLAITDEETVQAITDKVVQKLTSNFAGYLRENSENFEQDLHFIHQVFKLDQVQKHAE